MAPFSPCYMTSRTLVLILEENQQVRIFRRNRSQVFAWKFAGSVEALDTSCSNRGMQRTATLFAALVILVTAVLKFFAMTQVPLVGHELKDLTIGLGELLAWKNFYYGVISPEDARLPFLISLPFAFFYSPFSLGFYRLPFLLFHFATLFIYYRIGRLLLESTWRRLWIALLAVACWISGFAIFSATTGDSLYLFFHALTIYCVLSYGYTRFFRLMLVLSLCIASKIFGVALLVACFLHQLKIAREIKVSAHLTTMLIGSWIYLLVLVGINQGPFPLNEQSLFSTAAGLAYLCFFFLQAKWPRPEPKAYSPFFYWMTGSVVCLSLVTCFSPLYLNLSNIIRVLAFSDWKWESGAGAMDVVTLMMDKLGWLTLAVVVASVIYLKVYKIGGDKIKTGFLLSVFISQFVMLSLISPKFSWAPLVIFPFVFLPVFLVLAKGNLSRPAVLMILIILFGEQIGKYAYWFPFAHWDGAQYGADHRGESKSGFITYEFGPQMLALLETLPEQEEPTPILVQLSGEPQKNKYATEVMAFTSQSQKTRFHFMAQALGLPQHHLVLTSPISAPEIEKDMVMRGYKLMRAFEMKGIIVANLWQPNLAE